MNYTRKLISFMFILFIVFMLFFIIKNTKRDKRCNKIVILEDGEVITCMWVNTYKSGFSSVHTCDGSDVTIKTNLIKNIKIK